MHFPRNKDYKQVENVTVKKTMQGDLAKLLKCDLISRIYKKPPKPRKHRRFHRKEGYYSITELGMEYIKMYKITAAICQ